MPIPPEKAHLYPPRKEWMAIRARILTRAGDACEQCKAPNHVHIARGVDGDAGTYMLQSGDVYDAETGKRLGSARGSEYESKRPTYVILTVAHLDHNPRNNNDGNLRALCQRCHLAHDLELHKANAAKTRSRKRDEKAAARGQGRLA